MQWAPVVGVLVCNVTMIPFEDLCAKVANALQGKQLSYAQILEAVSDDDMGVGLAIMHLELTRRIRKVTGSKPQHAGGTGFLWEMTVSERDDF